MYKLSMCRICLVEDVKMYSLISANLQNLYERLTRTPFETKDRPIQICYLCCARLQNCYRLQAVCLKSEEFFNKVIADSELNEMELQDLNTLKTVHPVIIISCVPSTRKDPEDNKIDEDNDFKFDASEIASDVQIKHEDDLFANEEVHIKAEVTVEEEDICAKYGVISDNRHTIQNTKLEHDIHLKTVKIVLERIDLEAFKLGGFAAKKPKSVNTEITMSTKPETEVTVVQNNNIEKKIQTTESPATVKNKNSVEQISFIKKKRIEKKNIELSSDADDSSIKVYRCVVCEKTFSGKSELLSHTSTHTGEKPHTCKICEKNFSWKNVLQLHTRRHTGERPYRCNVCEKSFIAKNPLLVHSRVHTGKKPYSCKICKKSFSQRCSLVKHTRIHTGEKPYSCKICEKSFSQRCSLVRHTRIHTGEKPYRCKICEKSFSRSSHLGSHMLTHCAERPYTCDTCLKMFSRKSNLIRHIHTHENPLKYAM